jgi:hypothetical protein
VANLSELNLKLLEKVEERTLYVATEKESIKHLLVKEFK